MLTNIHFCFILSLRWCFIIHLGLVILFTIFLLLKIFVVKNIWKYRRLYDEALEVYTERNFPARKKSTFPGPEWKLKVRLEHSNKNRLKPALIGPTQFLVYRKKWAFNLQLRFLKAYCMHIYGNFFQYILKSRCISKTKNIQL